MPGGGSTGKGGGTNAPGKKGKKGSGGTTAPKGSNATTGVSGARTGPSGHKQPPKKAPKKPEHAGEVYNPGQKNKTIDPFMTSEDIMSYANARSEYEHELNELDYNYSNAVRETGTQEEAITKRKGFDLEEAKNDMAARGLQRSSVRDADLFDINATAEMKKKTLDSNLQALALHTDTEKQRLHDFWERPDTGYMAGLNAKKVKNAQEASTEAGEWAHEPGWEKGPAGSKPPAKPKNQQNKGAPKPHGGNAQTGYKPPPTKTGGTQAPKGSRATTGVSHAKPIQGRNYL